jgi:hypothetical protein
MTAPTKHVGQPLVARDTFDVEGRLTAGAAVVFDGVESVSLSADESDYALNDATQILGIDATTDIAIDAMQGGVQGRVVSIINRQSSVGTITLSAIAGRTGTDFFGTLVDTVLAPGDGALVQYFDPGGAGIAAWRVLVVKPAAPTGSGPFTLPLYSGNASTKQGSGTKLLLGGTYFDPTDPVHGLSGSSTATLYMLLESTSGSVAAAGELFQKSGSGSPQIIAATGTTTSTTADLVSADVSTAFTDTSAAGIFVARLWIVTPNGFNEATCTGAWIEVIP